MKNEACKILMLLDNTFVSDQRVEKECRSLRSAGFEVSVMCVIGPDLPIEELKEGVSVSRLIPPNFRSVFSGSYRREEKSLIRHIIGLDFRILHCHDYFMLNLGGKIKQQRPEIFLTYDSHEYFRKWNYYQEIKSPWKRFKGFLVWRYLVEKEKINCRHNINALIVTSSGIGSAIQEDYKLQLSPMVVRNISDLVVRGSNTEEDDLRKLLKLDDSAILMLQSGNVYQDPKMLKQWFDIIVDIPKLHFVIINNKAIAKTIREMVATNTSWEKRIHVVSYNPSHLANQIQSADFGVLYMKSAQWTSHYLGSPNRMMEYGACGLPYISVPHFATEELADEYHHVVFYSEDDPVSLQSAIEEMVATLPNKKANAAKLVASLDWKHEFNRVLELYRIICELPVN